ncbi:MULTISPECIES: ABC transporter ATP-binding protein [Peribacillus]|uniref:ABC transporter ATP-binding protein n=1 Tax=Peribacillus TaxID=2675229 RepID=UPI001912698C|nr:MULTISPECIES: ABC transporter ATP-binding protein [unclassified Peribacillus]MBK5444823.1 ABC transporter ATP-binding protein [Peribacillus sp. TH24]MBK5460459.1 ABC transporter ATP-binding protein [Peribacillus sp. TH27]MBK5482249.1 ABC transporter ATP-binding protein [Peribacillus sp. TH16]MBK5498627.1 ABC transporter ATP-binding protein [Peribacillus sp. TH14]WMX56260.1 ABC transporter ATP-binding protein [Peribacillus sp. R9-11]
MLSITDLEKSYSTKKILNGVNLQIKKGEILGFIGANGAGKTTTLNIITGILDYENGMVEINGLTKEDGIEYKKQFFFIPDTINVFKNVSGLDWIRFLMNLYDNEDNESLDEYISRFGMQESINKPMGSYSYGMMHKVSLIAAFTINPPIIIMDEPLNGLDPNAVLVYKGLIKQYVEKGGTVFFSTHLLDVAEKVCNTVAILKEGKIILHDEIKNIIGESSLESIFMEAQVYEGKTSIN